jgi:hypothetical protein
MTDILQRLKDLEKRKKELKTEANAIRSDFESYIVDNNIPLGERWYLFSHSPDELNNHEDYLISAKSSGLQYILDNWFDAPEVYGRGKKINTKKFFEDIFEEKTLKYNEDEYESDEIEWFKEAMEEILAQNCGSFCFDW